MTENEKAYEDELEKVRNKHRIEMAMLMAENDLNSHKSRARSLTVGTAFGGVLEVVMRNHNNEYIWATLSPSEAIEFINQMAAGIGCHIHIIPRDDFASWRNWNTNPGNKGLNYKPNQPPQLGYKSDEDPILLQKKSELQNSKLSQLGINGTETTNNPEKEKVNGQDVAT